jgi:hypothetical protein
MDIGDRTRSMVDPMALIRPIESSHIAYISGSGRAPVPVARTSSTNSNNGSVHERPRRASAIDNLNGSSMDERIRRAVKAVRARQDPLQRQFARAFDDTNSPHGTVSTASSTGSTERRWGELSLPSVTSTVGSKFGDLTMPQGGQMYTQRNNALDITRVSRSVSMQSNPMYGSILPDGLGSTSNVDKYGLVPVKDDIKGRDVYAYGIVAEGKKRAKQTVLGGRNSESSVEPLEPEHVKLGRWMPLERFETVTTPDAIYNLEMLKNEKYSPPATVAKFLSETGIVRARMMQEIDMPPMEGVSGGVNGCYFEALCHVFAKYFIAEFHLIPGASFLVPYLHNIRGWTRRDPKMGRINWDLWRTFVPTFSPIFEKEPDKTTNSGLVIRQQKGAALLAETQQDATEILVAFLDFIYFGGTIVVERTYRENLGGHDYVISKPDRYRRDGCFMLYSNPNPTQPPPITVSQRDSAGRLVPIINEPNIKTSLSNIMTVEQTERVHGIRNDIDMVNVDNVREKRIVRVDGRTSTGAPLLIIDINRLYFMAGIRPGVKTNVTLTQFMTLDIAPFVVRNFTGPTKWRLDLVLVHRNGPGALEVLDSNFINNTVIKSAISSGETLYARHVGVGHWYAFVCAGGKWYRCDGSKVETAELYEVEEEAGSDGKVFFYVPQRV